SVRLDIRRIAAIKDGEAVVGNRTKIKVVKNKLASPFREAEFDIIYGEGISREGEMIDLGVQHNVVEQRAPWFRYKTERIGQGRETARQFLKDNPDIRQSVDTELRKTLGLIKLEAAPEPAAAAEAPGARLWRVSHHDRTRPSARHPAQAGTLGSETRQPDAHGLSRA